MKMFNEPKIYTVGIDVTAWNDLSKKEKQSALNKRWYVYYSFRDPETNNLKRQPNLHLSANRLTTKTERLRKLEYIKLEIQLLLRAGYNPYEENQRFFDVFKSQNTDNKLVDNDKDLIETSLVEDNLRLQPEVNTITDAFEMALEQKKAVMGHSSYIKYRSRINNLKSWLGNIFKLDTDAIDQIGKKHIMAFLNETLIRTSPRNRNNTRTDISSLFQLLEDNDIIKENFVKKVKCKLES